MICYILDGAEVTGCLQILRKGFPVDFQDIQEKFWEISSRNSEKFQVVFVILR